MQLTALRGERPLCAQRERSRADRIAGQKRQPDHFEPALVVVPRRAFPDRLGVLERFQRLGPKMRRGQRSRSKDLVHGSRPDRQLASVDCVEASQATREVTAREPDPRQLALHHERGGLGPDAGEQITRAREVRLGDGDVAAFGQQPAAVTEQLCLPERVLLAAERPQRLVGAGERLGRVPRVPQHADPEHLRSRPLVWV